VFNLSLRLRRKLAASYTVLRYEDLVRDPNGCLAQLTANVGIDLATAPVGDQVELAVSHTAAGNPSRFKTGSVTIKPDEAWRTDMSRAAQMLVTFMTAPGLIGYGYGIGRSATLSPRHDQEPP
jgi:hypothetical protein